MVPQTVTSHHRRSRVAKEHSQPTLWSVATVSFALGAALGALTLWQLHRLYMATVAPVVTVEGTVQAKYNYQEDNELSPDPNGYYVISPSVGRIYLTGQPLDGYVGQPVEAMGSVSGICGPKSVPCYPIVNVRTIGNPTAE